MIAGADVKLMADDTARAYRRAGFQVHTSPFRYCFPLATVERDLALDPKSGPDLRLSIDTDRDSIFVWLSTSVSFRDMDDAPQGTEEWFEMVPLNLEDATSGYRLVGPDRTLPHQAVAGTDGAPFVLGFPWVVPPGGRLTATFRRTRNGFAMLELQGVKLFTTPYTRRVIVPDVPEAVAA